MLFSASSSESPTKGRVREMQKIKYIYPNRTANKLWYKGGEPRKATARKAPEQTEQKVNHRLLKGSEGGGREDDHDV